LLGTNAADALLEAARQQRSDLVVVGARGLGGVTGLRIGGVALRTLHEADRSVVLVPPG
jgi:nucleotide-binding universal stress UspA family protein